MWARDDGRAGAQQAEKHYACKTLHQNFELAFQVAQVINDIHVLKVVHRFEDLIII